MHNQYIYSAEGLPYFCSQVWSAICANFWSGNLDCLYRNPALGYIQRVKFRDCLFDPPSSSCLSGTTTWLQSTTTALWFSEEVLTPRVMWGVKKQICKCIILPTSHVVHAQSSTPGRLHDCYFITVNPNFLPATSISHPVQFNWLRAESEKPLFLQLKTCFDVLTAATSCCMVVMWSCIPHDVSLYSPATRSRTGWIFLGV